MSPPAHNLRRGWWAAHRDRYREPAPIAAPSNRVDGTVSSNGRHQPASQPNVSVRPLRRGEVMFLFAEARALVETFRRLLAELCAVPGVREAFIHRAAVVAGRATIVDLYTTGAP